METDGILEVGRSVVIPTFPGGADEYLAYLKSDRGITIYPSSEEILRSAAASGGIPRGQVSVRVMRAETLFLGPRPWKATSLHTRYSQVLEAGEGDGLSPLSPLIVPFLGDLFGGLGVCAIFAGMEPSAIPGEKDPQILCFRVVEGEEMDIITFTERISIPQRSFVAFESRV